MPEREPDRDGQCDQCGCHDQPHPGVPCPFLRLQCNDHFLQGLEAVGGSRLKAANDDVLPAPLKLLTREPDKRLRARGTLILTRRPRARPHFADNNTKRVLISEEGHLPGFTLFGRHKAWCALAALFSDSIVPVEDIERQTKVSNDSPKLAWGRTRQHDISCVQVPVNDAQRVSGAKTTNHLLDQFQSRCRFYRPVMANVFIQGETLNEFHTQEPNFVLNRGLMSEEFVYAADIWMGDRTCLLHFTPEALENFCVIR